MPHKHPEQRRAYDRAYKRRRRARLKAEAAQRREQERLRLRQEADMRARNLVPMILNWPLEFADRTYRGGELVWVLPGTAHMLARARMAEPAKGETVVMTRVITGPPPDSFDVKPHDPPKERTAAGY